MPRSWHHRALGHWMLEEEAQHLPCGVRPSGIGVRTGRTAARPRVPGSVDFPMLENDVSSCIGVDGAGVGVAPSYPTAIYRPRIRGGRALGNDPISVTRVHRRVAVSMKD